MPKAFTCPWDAAPLRAVSASFCRPRPRPRLFYSSHIRVSSKIGISASINTSINTSINNNTSPTNNTKNLHRPNTSFGYISEPTLLRHLSSSSSRHASNRPKSSPKQPITRTIDAAKERTHPVRDNVRSSLPHLTPHENIYNLPNFLTVTRLFAAPATAYLLLHDQHAYALALFAYAGITDLVDGWMARKWKLQTVAGSVMDPMADKALMIILTVTLAVKGAIPLYLATLILGRDASLALAAIYYRYASLPAPKTILRYWDFSLPSAEVHPTTVSKSNTFLQLMLIGSTLALPVITAAHYEVGLLSSLGLGTSQLHGAMTYFQWLVAATTAWSGLSYAFLKNAVTILGSDEAMKSKQGARGRAIIGVTFGSCVLAASWLAYHVDDVSSSHSDAPSISKQEESLEGC